MKRKRSEKKPPEEPLWNLDSDPLAHHPFEALKDLKAAPPEPEPEPKAGPAAPAPPPVADEDGIFRSAMADVRPLPKPSRRVSGSPPPASPRQPVFSEDDEVLAQLEDLVAGRAEFDLVDTDEYLEGYVRGIHPIVVEKLRKGRFSVQAHLDLHGLTVREAEAAVREFIEEAETLNYRCVLLVHGRGLNSKDQIPVLKARLEKILLQGPVRRKLLAFASARPHDGGAGASYVLLRARKMPQPPTGGRG
jgi:DNA-nicking Smr family endonuclease